MKSFKDISPSLSPECLEAVASFGRNIGVDPIYPTPVQAASIPLFLSNKDVCVEATTGSGKTLAFGIPIFEIIRRYESNILKYDVGAMVIAPTRELATQIFDVFSQFTSFYRSIRCILLVGGSSVDDNINDFTENGGQIVVGTPGRIIDIKKKCFQFNLKKLEVFVLDEADTLLDMGFKDAINQIFSWLPKQRRTGLFSATQTKETQELARAGLRNPVSISVRVQQKSGLGNKDKNEKVQTMATPSTLTNVFAICEYDHRPGFLVSFLQQHVNDKIIVFCATCACVEYYSLAFERLCKQDQLFPKSFTVVGFHGKMVPKKRKGLYQRFVSVHSAGAVMFCTDVAARGIDIPDVDYIVQLAAPKDPDFFVHRVGRTARAGRSGGALLLVTPEERPYIELLRGRGVPLEEDTSLTYQDSDIVQKVISRLRELSTQERELLEFGSTAFMSFLRAYKENLCGYIFRLESLSIGAVARGYGLLRLPKIAETRGVRGRPIDFEACSTDTSLIPYRHREKEEARQRKQKAFMEEKEKEKAERQLPREEGDEEEEDRTKAVAGRDQQVKKKWLTPEEMQAQRQMEAEQKRKRKKKQTIHQKLQTEWDELAMEETNYKKFKKGKISEDDYDKCLFDDSVVGMDVDGKVSANEDAVRSDSSENDSVDNSDDESSTQEEASALPKDTPQLKKKTAAAKTVTRNRKRVSRGPLRKPIRG